MTDFGKPSVKVVLYQPQVPCGALAQTVLAKAMVTVKPVSLEPDVTSNRSTDSDNESHELRTLAGDRPALTEHMSTVSAGEGSRYAGERDDERIDGRVPPRGAA